MGKPGYVNKKHYTMFVETVKDLKRRNEIEAAEQLLLKLVDAMEAEENVKHCGVAPWYYEQLAIIYAKQKDVAKEFAILERYERQHKAPGPSSDKLITRIAKVRQKIIK